MLGLLAVERRRGLEEALVVTICEQRRWRGRTWKCSPSLWRDTWWSAVHVSSCSRPSPVWSCRRLTVNQGSIGANDSLEGLDRDFAWSLQEKSPMERCPNQVTPQTKMSQ